MSKIAQKSVDVSATLLKYGISGACYCLNCGVRATKTVLGEAKDLAAQFSGCNVGGNIGGFMLDETAKLVETGTKKIEKVSAKGIDLFAGKVKSYL